MADAATFRALHRRGEPLLLPNIWDAVSARVVERAGFPALATTSAGLANALGYGDGELVDVDELVAAVRRIARIATTPLSVDIEAGLHEEIDDMVRNVARVRDAGAVAINLEDWNVRTAAPYAVGVAQARVAAVKARFGDALFVNARSDLYLHGHGEDAARFDATVQRLQAFVQAGADGVFVPGVADLETIGRLAAAVDVPLNVLVGPATPPVRELAAVGVARISLGSAPMRRAMGEFRALVDELRESGTFGFTRSERSMSYAELNALFDR